MSKHYSLANHLLRISIHGMPWPGVLLMPGANSSSWRKFCDSSRRNLCQTDSLCSVS